MQRVEMLKIAECTQLIDPAEVVVSQGVVLSAEPVLTPIGGCTDRRRSPLTLHRAHRSACCDGGRGGGLPRAASGHCGVRWSDW